MKKVFTLIAMLSVGVSMWAQKFDIDTILYNGPSKYYIDVVLLPDGYTADELDEFKKHATDVTNAFFSYSPYKEYKNFFNFFAVRVPSNESGCTGDKGSTYNEAMQHTVDTYFHASYWTNSGGSPMERLIGLRNNGTALAQQVAAANVPNYDLVGVAVNSDKYGGAGGTVLTFAARNSESFKLFVHEGGHTFGDLADEYWPGPQYLSYSTSKRNFSDNGDDSTVKWKNWLGESYAGNRVIKSTAFNAREAGNQYANKYYRPSNEGCIMRAFTYSVATFCPVCIEALVETIHGAATVILSKSPSKSVKMQDDDVVFTIDYMRPEPNTVDVKWILDGEVVAEGSDSYTLPAAELETGRHSLSVTLEDVTPLIRIEKHTHIPTYVWSITKDESTGVELDSYETDFSIAPTLFSDNITVKAGSADKAMRVELVDMAGKVRKKAKAANGEVTLATTDLASGVYVLVVYENNLKVVTRKVVRQ